ncbi:MAG TPA: alpha/beta hydrolase [Gemmatimonadaceae bacterium]|nr:alpha/beta hydrolase [Gemmatimonadaceae bacterium]
MKRSSASTRAIRPLLLALATACVAVPAAGQQPLPFDSVAALTAPPPDHRIAYGPGPLQFVNLRLPKRPGPRPVVVFIHGGCFLSQYSIAHAAALEQAFADSGYAVWSIEYRRVGDDGGGWPGTFEDVARAADHLRSVAKRYSLDLHRVVAAGHSAGADLALWLAARNRLRKESPLRVDNPLPIRAVLALAPAPDLGALHAQGVCDHVIDKLMGGSPASVPERYGDVSPALMIPIGVPQVVIIGAQDRNWGPPGRAYRSAVVAAHDTLVRFVDAPDAGHFDVIAPTSTSWGLVMQALRDLFARIGP